MIRNIILDLGGVILDVDYNRAVVAFGNLNISNFDQLYTQKKQATFFDQFEKGIISAQDFRAEIRKMNSGLTDHEIDSAWNDMILTTPPERMLYLKALSGRYNLYLLSNTNEIHIPAFTKYFDGVYGKNHFQSLFRKIYLSSEMKMRKPDPEIFNYVLDENKLIKTETVFVDDSPQHIEGAGKVGLNAILLPIGKKIETFLDSELERVNSVLY